MLPASTLPKCPLQALSLSKTGKRLLPMILTTRLQDIVSVGTRHVSHQAASSPPDVAASKDTRTMQRASSAPVGILSHNPQRYFNTKYKERVLLTDGTFATFRLVRPSDHDLWVDGFSRLSPLSRYLRFCAAKKHLTEKEIRYFTVLDQENHFAIIAVREDRAKQEVALGVARFIRSDQDPTRAEPAITVTDDAQSHGLGTVLALRLAAAAKERGIEYFDASVLGSNDRVIRLIRDIAPNSTLRRYGSDTVISTKLPDIDPLESWVHLHEPQEQQQYNKKDQDGEEGGTSSDLLQTFVA